MTTQQPQTIKKEAPLSRIGRKPIPIPAGVKVSVSGSQVTVEGKRGKLSWNFPEGLTAGIEANLVQVKTIRPDSSLKALHGLSRKLVSNMIDGVANGFVKKLLVEGVGFRASVSGDKLTMSLGFSHQAIFIIPKDVKVFIDPKIANMIVIEGNDKQRVGEVAAQIRAIKKPEPYKGTGIRYEDEVIKRKAGKAVAGAGAGAAGGGKK